MERRKRRSFTAEFRADAVRLVREGSKSLPQVANDIDLTESALRNWVHEADGDKSKEPAGALPQAGREEGLQKESLCLAATVEEPRKQRRARVEWAGLQRRTESTGRASPVRGVEAGERCWRR